MKKLTEKEIFEFSIAFGLVFLVLYIWKSHTAFLYLSIIILAGALFFRKVNETIFFYITKIGSKLGTILSKVFLTLAYYLILVPTAFLYKKFTDLEKTSFFKNKDRDSYFFDRKKQITKDSFNKPW